MDGKTYLNTLRAAEKLFNRFGFAKTAMTDIAAAADVSRATIFNNFGNKEGVLKAVLDNRRKELRSSILSGIEKTHSLSGKIKALLFERIKMLSAMKFISEEAIAVEHEAVESFLREINIFFINKTTDVLSGRCRSREDMKRLINTLQFILKGMEQGISGKLESFSLVQAEKDIDYFLQLALPEDKKENGL